MSQRANLANLANLANEPTPQKKAAPKGGLFCAG
jgi:hypothetical protein